MIKDSEIECLQKMQNKCINLVDKSRTSIEKKYKDLRILHIQEILDLELLTNDLPMKLLTCISTNEASKSLKKNHDYLTRQKNLVNLPKVQNNKYSKSFLCAAIRHIQPLLFITKDSYNLKHFVTKYKQQLFATGNN